MIILKWKWNEIYWKWKCNDNMWLFMNCYVLSDADSSCVLHYTGEMQLLLEWKLNGRRPLWWDQRSKYAVRTFSNRNCLQPKHPETLMISKPALVFDPYLFSYCKSLYFLVMKFLSYYYDNSYDIIINCIIIFILLSPLNECVYWSFQQVR